MKKISLGFSLVELLVAIAIVALLSALSIPYLAEYLKQSHGSSAMKHAYSYVTKAQACNASGIGCDTLRREISSIPQLKQGSTQNPIEGGGIVLAWDEGSCLLTATISTANRISYQIEPSQGAIGITLADCREGAGLQ